MAVTAITPNAPNLGKVVSAPSGDTTFRVAASSGFVTITSGGGKRVGAGTSRATVSVTCTTGCNSNANITITNVGSPTARARALTNFTVAMGTAQLISGPTGTNPLTFTIGPIPKNTTKTFYVGGDFSIAGNDSGLTTGMATSGFAVSITPATGRATTNTRTSLAVARVFRPVSLSYLPAGGLAFGRIVRPSVGSGAVTLDAATGDVTVSGTDAIGLPTPAPHRVLYTATGEGGQFISISMPAIFDMKAGASTLTVTPNATASGAQALSNALGATGTFVFGVGGSFPFTSTTPGGAYTGTFMVTVSYN